MNAHKLILLIILSVCFWACKNPKSDITTSALTVKDLSELPIPYDTVEKKFLMSEKSLLLRKFRFSPSNGYGKGNTYAPGKVGPNTPELDFIQACTEFTNAVSDSNVEFTSLFSKARSLKGIADKRQQVYADQLTSAGLGYRIIRMPPSALDKNLSDYLHVLNINFYLDPYLIANLLERAKPYITSSTYQLELSQAINIYLSERSNEQKLINELTWNRLIVDSLKKPGNITRKDLREIYHRHAALLGVLNAEYELNSFHQAAPFFEPYLKNNNK